MTFSKKNRVNALLAMILTMAAVPAFADTTMSSSDAAQNAADSARNAANSASYSANAAANNAAAAGATDMTNRSGNAAGITGADKTAMDTALGKGSCANDVQQFCSSITPGEGRVAACLHSHNDAISSTCQTQLKTAATEFKTMHKACRNDAQKYCKGAEAGNGGLISCLKQHEDQLSSSCKSDTANFEATS